MKKLLIATLLLVFGVAGCNSVNSRIDEKSAVFNSLDPQTQARLRQGLIDVGYTEDMVYIAMGKPDQRKEVTTANGHETTWIYKNYWEEYEGSHVVGYHRFVYYDPLLRAYRVYYEPRRADVYQPREEDRTRVQFKDGHVTSIESAKP